MEPPIDALQLLFKGEYALIMARTVDQHVPDYGLADVPAIIGAASMLGRLETAESLFAKYRLQFTTDQLVFCRFYLGVTYCRHYRFKESLTAFIENWKSGRQSANDATRFFVFQGLGFYRYTYGRFANAYAWVDRALKAAVGGHFMFGRVWAGDLKAHAAIAVGDIRYGLRLCEDTADLAQQLGLHKVAEATRISLLLYRSNFGLLGNAAPEHLQTFARSISVTDTYSRGSVLLEIARQWMLRGDLLAAKTTIDDACQTIYETGNVRLETHLALRLGYLLRLQGAWHQALIVVENSWLKLQHFADQYLELKVKGLRIGLMAHLKLHRSYGTAEQEVVRLTKRTGHVVAKRMVARAEANNSAAQQPGMDPLGDALDALAESRESILAVIIERQWFGLLAHYFKVSAADERLIFDVGSSGSMTLFAEGSVFYIAKGVTPLVRKLLQLLCGQDMTKEAIVRGLWGYRYHPQKHDPLIYTVVTNTRKLLGRYSNWLSVEQGGYKLKSSVTVSEWRSGDAQHLKPISIPVNEPEDLRAGAYAAANSDTNFRQEALLQRLQPDEFFDVHKYQAWFNVSEATANRDLATLVKSGRLRRSGKARATRYQAT